MITSTTTHYDGLDQIVWTITIDGEQVAELAHHTSGLILSVDTDPEHRGQGYARALYEAADAAHGLLHVPTWGRTEDGDAFADAMGGDTMDDQQAADILGLDLDTVTGAAFAA